MALGTGKRSGCPVTMTGGATAGAGIDETIGEGAGCAIGIRGRVIGRTFGLRFGIAWSCYDDVAGAVIAKAHGLNSELLSDNADNTDIYRIMYATLFGVQLP